MRDNGGVVGPDLRLAGEPEPVQGGGQGVQDRSLIYFPCCVELFRQWGPPQPSRLTLRRRQGIPTDQPSTRTGPTAPVCSSTPVNSAPPPHPPLSTSSPNHTAAA